MHNRQLHQALEAFADEAAWQLSCDAAEGHELDFDVVPTPGVRRGRKQPAGSAFYCYRPLTAAFIAKRESVIARLPSYLPAVHAVQALGGLEAYLEAFVARGGLPTEARERAELALRAFLSRVFEDSSDFALLPERFEAALAELEDIACEGRAETVVVVPVVGLRLQSAEVALTSDLVLIRGEVVEDAPTDAVWPQGAHLPDAAAVLAVVRGELSVEEDEPLDHARSTLRRLLTSLRLFDAAPVTLGPSAWMRSAGGPWSAVALGIDAGAPTVEGEPCVVTAEEEDELRAFCSLVGRRLPRSGELAWALRRYELACARPTPGEALTDLLLALRAMLEPEGAQSHRLGGRVAALCAEPEERSAHAQRIAFTARLERSVITNAGAPDPDILLDLVEELAGDCRAILRDVLCGHLDPDVRMVADRLLEADQPTGDLPSLL